MWMNSEHGCTQIPQGGGVGASHPVGSDNIFINIAPMSDSHILFGRLTEGDRPWIDSPGCQAS